MVLTRIRRHKISAIIGTIILLLFIAVASMVIFSGPIVRWLMEENGSRITGRELTIDGPLALEWHWTYTAIRAHNIRLSNMPGYREPDMLSIDALEFTVKPLKLLVGKLELGSLGLEKPVLILEQKTPQESNWNFLFLAGNQERAENQEKGTFIHTVELTDRLTIKQGRILYRNAVRQLTLDVKLDSKSDADAAQNNKYQFVLSGSGKLLDRPVALKAFAGSLDALRNPAADFPLHLILDMDRTRIEIDGVFNEIIKFSGINASLKINGDNLADLFYLTAIPLPPTPPYILEGQLTKEGDLWGYHNFTGNVGESDLSGSLSYDLGKPRGFLKADLHSKVLKGADLGGFIGLPPPLATKHATREQKQAALEKELSAKLIPDVPLNVERLRTTDLDVTLNAQAISAPNLPFKGMEVRFYLHDGQLTLDPFKAVLADGTVDGIIKIDARPELPPMTMQLNLRKLSLNKFFENTRFATTTAGFFGGHLTLAGTGASLADVLATSNGEMAIIISGGKISLLLIEASDVDIGEAVPLLLGKDKSTRIRCGVADFNVNDGMLDSKNFVLDTDDSLLTGKVGVDLKRERITARLDAKPKDNSLLSAHVPITLSGKLKAPRVGLDAGKTGSRSAAAIALGTLLSPVAALLAFIETGDAEDADCRALIAAAKKDN